MTCLQVNATFLLLYWVLICLMSLIWVSLCWSSRHQRNSFFSELNRLLQKYWQCVTKHNLHSRHFFAQRNSFFPSSNELLIFLQMWRRRLWQMNVTTRTRWKNVGEKETFSSTTLEPFRRKQNLRRKNDEFVDKLPRRWLERREASSPVMENNDRKSENKWNIQNEFPGQLIETHFVDRTPSVVSVATATKIISVFNFYFSLGDLSSGKPRRQSSRSRRLLVDPVRRRPRPRLQPVGDQFGRRKNKLFGDSVGTHSRFDGQVSRADVKSTRGRRVSKFKTFKTTDNRRMQPGHNLINLFTTVIDQCSQ